MMVSRVKSMVESNGEQGESWLVELVLPVLFTVVLAGCLAHLAYSAFQAQQQQACNAEYAISAFAS